MNVNEQLTVWLQTANDYFQQLTDYEKYGWIAEALGFILLVVGVVLLLL
jgi:hypothetical protein